MKKMINYPKTGQFNDVVRAVSHKATFVGLDENGDPIYDGTREKPTLVFEGTVKLHGTNAAVCYNGEEIWVQSRNNVVDSLTGHQGFAEFVHANKDYMNKMFEWLHVDGCVTTVYGEWVGPGIQKGVGVSELPQKMWFVFGVKITPEEGNAYWLADYDIVEGNDRVWDLRSMVTFRTVIDFNKPALCTSSLASITEAVENECPIAKQFGISGTGEGVVWVCNDNGERHLFKVKGEKHSSSKVKTLAQADPQKMQSVYDFVDYAATANRVEQAMNEVSGGDTTVLTKKNTPDILRWIANDIISEESATLQANNIEWKDVAKEVSDRARRIFFDKLESISV